MIIRVNRDVLADAVGWVAHTLPQRPAIPVLAGIMLKAADDIVTLSAFDFEASARTRFEAEVDEPGAVLVSGRMLSSIAKSLPNKPVELRLDGNKVSIDAGSSHFSLATMPVDEYPDLPKIPEVTGTIDAAELAVAVSQVAVAASGDDTLPLLATVQMVVNGPKITMLATDRYRLAMREVDWTPVDGKVEGAALVKARVLQEMSKQLTGGSVDVSLDVSGGTGALLAMAVSGQQMTSQLTQGDYPNVLGLFPAETPIHAVVPRAPLLEALRRVSLVVEHLAPVRMTFRSEGTLGLDAGRGDDAEFSEQLSCYFTGSDDEFLTAFNPGYLRDGLAAIDTEYVRMSFTHPNKPAVLTAQTEPEGAEVPGYKYLLMPVRYPG